MIKLKETQIKMIDDVYNMGMDGIERRKFNRKVSRLDRAMKALNVALGLCIAVLFLVAAYYALSVSPEDVQTVMETTGMSHNEVIWELTR